MALSPKQKAFCKEYLKDLNATASYQRAYGASYDAARANGAKLLANASIQQELAALQFKRSKRTEVTLDKVLAEIARIAFSNITDVVDFDSSGVVLKDSQTVDADVTSAIAEISSTATEKSTTFKVKMHNKLSALQLAAEHVGLRMPLNQALAAFPRYGYEVEQVESGYIIRDTYSPVTVGADGSDTDTTED